MENTVFIGIDIAKSSFEANVNNKIKRYNNNKGDIKRFLKETNALAIFVMESTGPYCYPLADALFADGRTVYIVNPASIHYFAKMQNKKAKTDKIDPILIQKYAEQNIYQLRAYQKPTQVIIESREAITLLEHYKKQKNAIDNQIEAITSKGNGNIQHVKMLKNDLDLVEKNIAKLEKEINDNMSNHYKEMYENISSIPSIGPTTAAMFIAITNGFLNFQTSKQLVSYLGACPVIVQSGTSINRSYISKVGKSLMRNRLYMCALTAIKRNKMCKEAYEAFLERAVPKKKALMSIINKLIRQIFACATKNQKFEESLNF